MLYFEKFKFRDSVTVTDGCVLERGGIYTLYVEDSRSVAWHLHLKGSDGGKDPGEQLIVNVK